MIYTVTFNPTLDLTLRLEAIQTGRVNRAESDALTPGGKGVNVSIVLTRLGLANRALGFAAGFTGEEFLRRMEMEGCDTDFITLPEGKTRINVVLRAGEETEINTSGPAIPQEAVAELMLRIKALEAGDTLVLAGSVPPTLPIDIYERMLEALQGKNVRVVVDATGELLRRVLPEKPFLIKPNIHELSALLGRELTTNEEIIAAAKELQGMGAQNVLVSLGPDGALLVCADGQVLAHAAPKGRVDSAVGAGDSMVAGFLAGFEKTGSYSAAFKMGLAAGSATAFNEWLATREQVATLLGDMA